jgi:hypothetical protein
MGRQGRGMRPDQGCVEFDSFVGEGFPPSFLAVANFGLRFSTVTSIKSIQEMQRLTDRVGLMFGQRKLISAIRRGRRATPSPWVRIHCVYGIEEAISPCLDSSIDPLVPCWYRILLLKTAEALSEIQNQSAQLLDVDSKLSPDILSAFALLDKTFYAIKHTVGACNFSIRSNMIFQHDIAADLSYSTCRTCFAGPFSTASSIESINNAH